MKFAIISTSKESLDKISQFVSGKDFISESKYIFLKLSDGFARDGLEVLKSKYDLSGFEAILLSDADIDQELAVCLAVHLKGVSVTSCADIMMVENTLKIKRQVYGGLAYLHLIAKNKPVIATIASSELEDPPSDIAGLTIEELNVESFSTQSKILSRNKIERTVDLASAKRIVSAGRGIQKKEDLEIIENLAAKLDAELGCSRPLSEDFKWLPVERQVGLTGETVQPDIYMAIGISGQVQHLVGMRDAKVVVAINNNKSAPIFESCDYGIVGDLYEIAPIMSEILSKEN